MLESFLSHLEEQAFGVRDFRRHVHRLDGQTASVSEHNHRIAVITGPPLPGPKGHVHRISGTTAKGKTHAHTHEIRGWTGPPNSNDANHTHSVDLKTLTTASHVHEVYGATSSFVANRSLAARLETRDGVLSQR
ncbi:MAG: YmaF family protein [Firmicutes bacterium]|nr:YmaF family protein [Bacillota bacterium]